ncbi:bifunctional serine/threonine-protein kinase/formylglycine-generating enzyme family protein [Prosthecobacter sp.]|uniref:bifunctional serine/threonine-protein kinase/formylglycine-generating enzyme family protein n=1 Tax=Prosthecobacter sp. TaxID=1965333 RepID=UPI00378503D8
MSRDPFLNQSMDAGDGLQMPSLKTGQRLFNGRYELLRMLGAGGMGVVWLARDHTEELDVALKFLPSVLVLQEVEMKRLREEVRAGKELRHPRLVATYGMEVENGIAAIVMEFVPGQTLKEKLETQERGFFEPEEISAWVKDMTDGLGYLHEEARRIHRDLKPANVMIGADARAKLMDFGISHRIKEGVSKHSKTNEGTAGSSSSTLAYASPQQITGKPSHKADDIYSLGATLYELLTGTPPFFRGGVDAVRGQIKDEPVTPIQERRQELVDEGLNVGVGAQASARIEQIVASCLSKEREKRPGAGKIEQSFHPTPESAHSFSPSPLAGSSKVLAALVLPALLGVGAWLFFLPPKKNSPAGSETKAAPQAHAQPKPAAPAPAPAPVTATLEQRITSAETICKQRFSLFKPAVAGDTLDQRVHAMETELWTLDLIKVGPGKTPTLEERFAAIEKVLYPSGPSAAKTTPAAAQKERPFINSLGMPFVPVSIGAGPSKGQSVLFSIWETRSKDYAEFVKATGYDAGEGWKKGSTLGIRLRLEDSIRLRVGCGIGERMEDSIYPVANVNYYDAVAFCIWLTQKDRAAGFIGPYDEYRLPTDLEWSYAIGIGDQEDSLASPKERDQNWKTRTYPWGTESAPPEGSGNYADLTYGTATGLPNAVRPPAFAPIIVGDDDEVKELKELLKRAPPEDFSIQLLSGKVANYYGDYTDGYALTAPVGSFKANTLGIFDLSGNVGEWTSSLYEFKKDDRVQRGGSWLSCKEGLLLPSRFCGSPDFRFCTNGFRCVLTAGESQHKAPPSAPSTKNYKDNRPRQK